MPDFSALLNIKADDIKEAPKIAAGDAILQVLAVKFVESGQKKTAGIEVEYSIQSYLSELQPDLTPASLGRKTFDTFWISSDETKRETSYRFIKEWITNCGIETAGRLLNELVPETVGQAVVGSLREVPNQNDQSRTHIEIKGYAKV